jgi:hypothetical protein
MQLENTNNLDSVVVNPNLKVIIEGLALAHFDGNQWKVFFPKVVEHEFKLTIKKKDNFTTVSTSSFALPNNSGLAGSRITLTPDNTGAPGTANPQVKDAMDISNFHGETIHLLPDRTKYAGFLILNGAQLFSEVNSSVTNFQIWDTRLTASPPIKVLAAARPLNNSFSAGFQVAPTQTTRIQVENDFGFNLSLTYGGNINYEVTISNDCEKPECEGITDFKRYYDIIDVGRFATDRRFELILVSGGGGKGRNGSCGGRAAEDLDPAGLP